MLPSAPRFPVGGVVVLLAFLLLHARGARGASLPRHHRYRGGGGGESEDRRPAGAPYLPPPSADMVKALEYIESLKQRNSGGAVGGDENTNEEEEEEMEKFRVLLQLASLQDQAAAARDRQAPPPPPPPPAAAAAQRQEVPAEQLVRALLRTLQDQAAARPAQPAPPPPPLPAAAAAGNDRRAYARLRPHAAAAPAPAPADYGGFPRPHKKYPLMFEDEEEEEERGGGGGRGEDVYRRRATEDLEEKYTPQSLANLRSIFNELGRIATSSSSSSNVDTRKRGASFRDAEEEEEEAFAPRNAAYEEDVAGGEDWLPLEEDTEETEELVNGSHEEFERDLGETPGKEEEEEEEEEEDEVGGGLQRRGDPQDDDTKLVDYYLLKILEMSDQTQKRDEDDKKRKRLVSRPSLADPRTINRLLKLHVPPEELLDMLLAEELRKLERRPLQKLPPPAPRYSATTASKPQIRYFSRRLPVKPAGPDDDMDREDFLDIIGVETISNEYPVRQRLLKPAPPPAARVATATAMVKAAPPPPPAKIPAPSGWRENLFLSELNKMPLKRQSNDDDDDEVDEDEVFLAAKILTQYPNSPISKRETRSSQTTTGGQRFPYDLYEQAMKDYLDLAAGTEKSVPAKRDSEMAEAVEAEQPTETQQKEEMVTAERTAAPDGKEQHGKPPGIM